MNARPLSPTRICRAEQRVTATNCPGCTRPDTPAPEAHFLRAAALPPLAPAFFFCAAVPPCLGLEPDPDFFPPRPEAPGLLAMRAARDLDIPFSFSFSYCFSFLTLADLDGISAPQPGRHYP